MENVECRLSFAAIVRVCFMRKPFESDVDIANVLVQCYTHSASDSRCRRRPCDAYRSFDVAHMRIDESRLWLHVYCALWDNEENA